ncbi:gluconate 2-dehydrogenase subunit 3 family protein [Pseudozobellia thermophila]|uniref:Gluconate 2-dehydrogenase subunit 3 n=1 Tax=Pseudozobellia thermophila TaxID=192903 RepID=A0A1M6NL74_9FLAO|nr:gluconate 2-dehydrogenase subunit 3 family protein [Pseudozobellia thermophila]SHJ96473.1 Gluconate 2-dehydrogenase subunit 3 [Pseudozobellia thermophila]
MDRREAVVKISWILKSAYLAPSVFTALVSCKGDVDESKLTVFNKEQNDLVKAIADTILPRTDTPSASDVQVDLYMDLLLNDVYDEPTRKSFLEGLEQFNENCKAFTRHTFSHLDGEERHAYLEKLDKKANSEKKDGWEAFFTRFKALTVQIYFSTEQGVKQNLDYVPLPGDYEGDVALGDNARIMVGN